jgi:hypothetical protein
MAKLPRVQVNVAEQPLFSQHLHQPSQTGLGKPEPGVVDLQQHKWQHGSNQVHIQGKALFPGGATCMTHMVSEFAIRKAHSGVSPPPPPRVACKHSLERVQ